MKIPLSEIDLPEKDLREYVDEEELHELADSLREHGQLQPIGVRKMPTGRFEVVFGARRTRAANILKWEFIDAAETELSNDHDTASKKLIENVQRKDLTQIEEAYGLLEIIGDTEPNIRDLMRQMGKSRSWVTTRLELVTLPDDLQKAVQSGLLSATVAIIFGEIQNPIVRNDLVSWAIQNGCTASQAKGWVMNAPHAEQGIEDMQNFVDETNNATHELTYAKPRFNCLGCLTPKDFDQINQVVLCKHCQDILTAERTKTA